MVYPQNGDRVLTTDTPGDVTSAYVCIRVQQTINQLPDKTLLHVFSYVRQQDLCRLAHVCKKWKMLAYEGRLWSRVSLRPDYGGLHVSNVDALVALIGARFGTALRYVELPAELVMPAVLHELANRCPNVKCVSSMHCVSSSSLTRSRLGQ